MVQVKDLKDHILEPQYAQEFLYCLECGAHCSAHSGDYFMAKPDYTFTCCDENMIIAKETTIISPVRR